MGHAPGSYQPSGCSYGVAGAIPSATAVHFDGNDCWVDIASGDLFGFGSNAPYTIEAWVKPDTSSKTFEHLFTHESRNANGPGNGYAMFLSDDHDVSQERSVLVGSDDPDNPKTDDIDLNFAGGDFVYVVATFDGTTMTTYADAQMMQSSDESVEFTPPDLDAYIGASQPNSNRFVGTLDDVAVYARALDQQTIQAHFSARSN